MTLVREDQIAEAAAGLVTDTIVLAGFADVVMMKNGCVGFTSLEIHEFAAQAGRRPPTYTLEADLDSDGKPYIVLRTRDGLDIEQDDLLEGSP